MLVLVSVVVIAIAVARTAGTATHERARLSATVTQNRVAVDCHADLARSGAASPPDVWVAFRLAQSYSRAQLRGALSALMPAVFIVDNECRDLIRMAVRIPHHALS
jgi:hypothetical protein